MKRKPPEVKKGAPEYMNTYGDMVTLLLCFFVLLFAMSTTDAKKFETMVTSLKGSLGVLKGGKTTVPEKIVTDSRIKSKGTEMKYKKIVEQLKNKIENIEKTISKDKNTVKDLIRQTEVRETERGVEITFGSSVLFDSGKAEIKEEIKTVLSKIADELKKIDNKVIIEGHTDNIPIKSYQFPSNWELSTARSVNVLRYIIGESPELIGRISAAGYADTIPRAENRTEEGKQMNRRVQIIILKNDEEKVIVKNIAEGGN